MGRHARRSTCSVLLAAAVGVAVGHLVSGAWLAAGILLVVFCVACPLAVCLCTPRSPSLRVLVVVLATLVMDLTLVVENYLHCRQSNRLDIFWEGYAGWRWVWLPGLTLAVALLFSMPAIAVRRSRDEVGGRRPRS